MLAAKAAVWGKKQDRAIERADVALDHSDYELYTTGPRYRSHALNFGSGYINRTFPIPAKILPTLSGAHTNGCTKVKSHRIARDKRFGKNRDLHTLACRVCNEVSGFSRVCPRFHTKGAACTTAARMIIHEVSTEFTKIRLA